MPDYGIRFHETGGPEVLRYEEIELPPPGRGEARIRITAVGLNFVDTYRRTGLYPVDLPSALGAEAVGVVTELGEGTTGLAVGDRVAHATGPLGAYATAQNVPADCLVSVPDGVTDESAAAVLLKGLTAWYLLRRTYPVRSGETVVFHAAAGGVGLIAGQWLRHLGVRAIGTVGSAEKAKVALENGYREVILYREDDVAARVRELTDGEGVPVVYDSVGAATFENSLDCLRPRGLMVSFGNASGPVTGVNLGILAAKGSLFVTRPTTAHYLNDRDELRAAAAELFDLVERGVTNPNVGQRFALADAANAHRALESRATTGATVLLP
ncbi:quinone oxidoreductase family protein [Cryptosporangium aurantiacum]|uniref:NADPH2:quinone reductase n=1 Tax=Cryptosporangium aurantiacum TaxID=134849 RepID=A0A1M7MZV4_9ACTN|nr:quinone oxidoreductase [Cryptosporangium aurantiacum]SHM96789.1 NADPH2:quinone reductase [Cryptosporangium aurantiacum]